MTDEQAIQRINVLMNARKPGWDQMCFGIILRRLYGSHEDFIASHMLMLHRRAELAREEDCVSHTRRKNGNATRHPVGTEDPDS